MFEKLPVVNKKNVHTGCLLCSTTRHPKVSMRRKICGDFDYISKNGKEVYSGIWDGSEYQWDNAPTLMKFENMARKDPGADWRYTRITALHDEEYQRQGRNLWVMVKSGMGYA